jgi:NADH-quinone oxidoreductase subunit L
MTVPLAVLAAGSILAGYLGKLPFTHLDWLGNFLAPVVLDVGGRGAAAHHGLGLELLLVGASVAAAAAGLLAAWRLWGRGRGPRGDAAFAARFPALYRTLAEKYRVDELYDRLIVRPLAALARACWKVVDVLLIDGAVHVGAFVTELAGDLGRLTTTGNVRNYALYFFAGVLLLFVWMVL